MPFRNRKPSSGYILNVSTVGIAQQARVQRVTDWLTPARKLLVILMVAAITGLGLLSGFMATTSTTATVAAAGPLEDFICFNKANDDNQYQGLAGQTRTMYATMTGSPTANPFKPPQNSAGIKTAYTLFGENFYPVFDSWDGYYTNDDEKFFGTGGSASFSKYEDGQKGPLTELNKDVVKKIPLYSHDGLQCTGLDRNVGNSFANAVFMIPKSIVVATASLYDFAFNAANISDSASPFNPLVRAVSDIITGNGESKGLKDTLFLPFLSPIIVIGAISLFWVGIVKRSSIAAFQAAIWMIGAATAGILFVNQPMLLPTASDFVVKTVTDTTNSAILGDPSATSLCNVSGGGAAMGQALVEEVKCSIWYNAIFIPWVSGQYGKTAEDITLPSQAVEFTNDPRGQLGRQSIEMSAGRGSGIAVPVNNWPYYELNNQSEARSFNLSEIAFAQLTNTLPNPGEAGPTNYTTYAGTSNGTWAGNSPWTPVGMAFLSLIASVGIGLMIFVSSIAVIFYSFTMIFLILLSPLFLLVGAAPGWGRRLALRWAELILVLVIKRIVISLMLAMFLRFYAIIMTLQGVNYIIQLALVCIVSFVAIFQRGKIMNMFTNAIDFGGDKNINVGSSGKGKALAAGLVGAGLGAVGGAIGAKGISGSAVAGLVGGKKPGGPGTTPGTTQPTSTSRKNTPPTGGNGSGSGSGGGGRKTPPVGGNETAGSGANAQIPPSSGTAQQPPVEQGKPNAQIPPSSADAGASAPKPVAEGKKGKAPVIASSGKNTTAPVTAGTGKNAVPPVAAAGAGKNAVPPVTTGNGKNTVPPIAGQRTASLPVGEEGQNATVPISAPTGSAPEIAETPGAGGSAETLTPSKPADPMANLPQSNIDPKKKAAEIRRKALAKGALAGAKAGFSSGGDVRRLATTHLAGMDAAKGVVGKNIDKLQTEGQKTRDAQVMALFGTQLDQQREAEKNQANREAQAAIQRQKEFNADQEAKDRRHEQQLTQQQRSAQAALDAENARAAKQQADIAKDAAMNRARFRGNAASGSGNNPVPSRTGSSNPIAPRPSSNSPLSPRPNRPNPNDGSNRPFPTKR